MNELPVWWLVLQATGVAAFPLTFVFFRWLPDRGLTLAKVVGLLLLGFGFWMTAVLGIVPPSRGAVIAVLVLLAGASWTIGSRRRDEMSEYIRTGWRYILLVELMFVVVLAASVYLRSFAPQIDSGEKPFELAFLNAVNRADSFPPNDPWLSGENVSYYYFGYVIVAALTKLTFLQTSVTFFLGLSTVAALTWVAVFGLVYNLIHVVQGNPSTPRLAVRPVIFGVVAAALVLVVSNLEGVFELMARHGVGGSGFYGLVGIHGLPGPYDCSATPTDCSEWYPTRHYWWWWATRIGSPADIQEFPFFSLHFGDLHAHVLAMPFLIALFSLVFQTVIAARDEAADRALDARWLVRHPCRALIIILLVGGIAFTDAWAIPLAASLLAAGVLLANWVRGASPLRIIWDTSAFLIPVLVLSVAFYIPFWLDLEADRQGFDIIQTAATPIGDPPANSESTRPLHFALFWVPMLLPTLALAVAGVRADRPRGGRLPALATIPWAVPLLVWTVWAFTNDGFTGLADEVQERAENLLTLAFLIVAITAVTLLFLRSLGDRGVQAVPATFVFLLAGFALVMLFGAELFYVQDFFGWRANTVFRFWHEAWIILGVAGGFALYRLTQTWRRTTSIIKSVPLSRAAASAFALGVVYNILVAVDPWETLYERWWTATAGLIVAGLAALTFVVASALADRTSRQAWRRLTWIGLTAAVLCAAFAYPVLVAFDRTGGFTNHQTLDGLDFVTRGEPYEREAIDWLNANVRGSPVILEAYGDDFTVAGRVSSRTGLPTVIGWLNHERQWRGDPDPSDTQETPYTVRPQEVARLYNTPVVGEAQIFIDKYDIQYVYVGNLERATYSLDGLLKFRGFMDTAYENPGVTIYRVREDVAEPAGIGR